MIDSTSYEQFAKLIIDYDADVYLFAHTHKYFEKVYKNRLFVNSGAVNLSMGRSKVSTFGILSLSDDLIIYDQIILDYDFEKVKGTILKVIFIKSIPNGAKLYYIC